MPPAEAVRTAKNSSYLNKTAERAKLPKAPRPALILGASLARCADNSRSASVVHRELRHRGSDDQRTDQEEDLASCLRTGGPRVPVVSPRVR
jgi:hypothetical protein